MQAKDCIVLVKPDFFLHEGNFQALRNFISFLDYEKVKFLDEFNYDFENDKIDHIHRSYDPNHSNLSLICDFIEKGYIAITFTNLKKMLSL